MAHRNLARGTGLALALALTASTTGASEPAPAAPKSVAAQKPTVQQDVDAQDAQTRTLAHKMMGHVNLAALALVSEVPEAAGDHLESARKLAAQLQREAPEMTSSTSFKYGKLSYKFQNEERDYYVPVIDDVFLLSDYKPVFHAFREADLEETEAGVVVVTLSVDLREVDKAVAEAQAKLAANQIPEARAALRDVFKNAVTDEELLTDPVWAVHDNLSLARNLIREHHYDGARFALAHARKNLEDLEKTEASEKESAEYKKMDEEIAQLSLRLKKEDPTLSESIDATYQSWMARVRGWFGADVAAVTPPM